MTTQTQTRTVTQWRREWRRLFKASMKAAHALPEYAALQDISRQYDRAIESGDEKATMILGKAYQKAHRAYIKASRRLPQDAEMDRIDAMLRNFDTYGCAAGVRS
jgi:N-acetylglucosamine kinase-like BadF-type ATPase